MAKQKSQVKKQTARVISVCADGHFKSHGVSLVTISCNRTLVIDVELSNDSWFKREGARRNFGRTGRRCLIWILVDISITYQHAFYLPRLVILYCRSFANRSIVMFTCNACLQRALNGLTSESAGSTLSTRSKNLLAGFEPVLSSHAGINQGRKLKRGHATLASLKKSHHRRDLNNLNRGSKHKLSPIGDKRRKEPWPLTKPETRDAVARERNRMTMSGRRPEDGDPDDLMPITPGMQNEAEIEEKKLVKRAEKEVETYLMDPLQLADQVLKRLRKSDFDAAMRLVVASQKYAIKNIVSWNHCIDWLMAQGEVKKALKLFNDMKKRGQMPDAHTYTLLLRGLSQNPKPWMAREATKLYGSIFAPNVNVPVSTIHTNAVINVCARAGDMDALWSVTSRLPEKGAGSPDKITYTTILSALRDNAIKEVARTLDVTQTPKDGTDHEIVRRNVLAKAVANGRKLWEDVSRRWRRADMQIDEALVCAMGRLMYSCGGRDDQEQIFDLITTTMNLRLPGEKGKYLRDLAAKNNHGSIETEDDAIQPFTEEVNGNQADVPAIDSSRSELHGETPSISTTTEKTVTSYRPRQAKLPFEEAQIYAAPGNKTLALLMDACQQTNKLAHLAPAYWHLLTDLNGKYRVQPDATNIVSYLRALRVNRASAEAYQVLANPWPNDVAEKLYRRSAFVIAMSTCSRDKNNPNVFNTARKILKLMQEKLEEKELGVYDDQKPLAEMSGKERHEFLLKQKQEVKNMSEEERAEFDRSREGVQSLPLDPKVLTYYLELAHSTTTGEYEGIRGKDIGDVFERDPKKNHIMVAIREIKPATMQLQALVKRKIEEIEQGGLNHRSTKGRKATVPQSRVGEDLQELLNLMRVMISAFDKVVFVGTRVNQIPGKAKVDEGLMAEYNKYKREYTYYLARIQKATGITPRNNESHEDQAVDQEAEIAEQDTALPQIEKRIKMVLGEIDESIMDTRAEKKGFKSPFFALSQAEKKPLKIHSKVQKAERDNIIDREMQRQFPKEDYGVLNEELQIETGKDAKRNIDLRDPSKHFTTFDVFGNRANSTEAVASMSTAQRRRHLQDVERAREVVTRSKQKRKPMIGDELGLDEEDEDDEIDDIQPLRASEVREDIPFEPRITRTDEPWKHNPKSILFRDDVRNAWQQTASVTTTA